MTTIRIAAAKATPSASVRRVRGPVVVLALAALLAAACGGGSAATTSPQSAGAGAARLAVVARGLSSPVGLAAPRSERGRMYVVEQAGTIRVIAGGRVRSGVFLDVRDRVVSGGEQGLLGLAFHPGYAKNHRFYVDYTDRNGDTNVVEYRANAAGTAAIRASARRILFVDQPYANHNGGHVAFGPDGFLYVGMGDGGSGGDPADRAQNMRARLGKLLRIDVSRSPVRISIAALGLRNPWAFSFDRANGDLWIADVGQSAIEEVNWIPRSQLGRLQNYGWDLFEGRSKFEDTPQGPGRLVGPVEQYSHDEGCSITGGVVYRGKAVASYVGRYIYGDYCSGTIWTLKLSGGKATGTRREPFRVSNLTAFAEDAANELYVASSGGTIYRLAR
jgi:glucose/arabinose dehydrogenase